MKHSDVDFRYLSCYKHGVIRKEPTTSSVSKHFEIATSPLKLLIEIRFQISVEVIHDIKILVSKTSGVEIVFL